MIWFRRCCFPTDPFDHSNAAFGKPQAGAQLQPDNDSPASIEFTASWQDLSRPSTFYGRFGSKDMDARDKRGHDGYDNAASGG
jgi:hypothetical protein